MDVIFPASLPRKIHIRQDFRNGFSDARHDSGLGVDNFESRAVTQR
jgi:hypothetical protein